MKMYEDALDYAEQALDHHDGKIATYYKAVSLAYFLKFDESIEIFNSMTLVNLSNEIEIVKSLKQQSDGEYHELIGHLINGH